MSWKSSWRRLIIPPKLFGITSDIIDEPLAITINIYLTKGFFSNSARIFSIIPLDNDKASKCEIPDNHAVSTLDTLSETYAKEVKSQMICYLDNHFPKKVTVNKIFSCIWLEKSIEVPISYLLNLHEKREKDKK